ncbi:MAG: pyridoxal phosphate-dependent aminotransferase family protein [Epsilonproteobacteria bacterium]|nr:pyridoxal phosphate-dependent aminotransferase family protein [Campylobacterota bacterium]
MYKDELQVLKQKNRFRQRKIVQDSKRDFASNDYLGLANKVEILDKTYNTLRGESYGSKASMLISGYTPYHQMLEEYLCEVNNYQAGIIVGSGFLANLSVFEALARKKDLIVLDEEYHASGRVGTKLSQAEVRYFKHNDLEDLIYKLQDSIHFKRVLVGVEGIYSMSGDIVKKEILDYLAVKKKVITVIDEAHSMGVVGDNLMGVVDLYKVPTINTIKIGTFSKALGSYGAYILASKEIISFLENRAKGIIYTTALSNFDTMQAYFALKYIKENLEYFQQEIKKRQNFLKIDGLIYKKEIKDDIIQLEKKISDAGFHVGLIRPPTVKTPMIRLTARICEDFEALEKLKGLIDG